MFLWDKAGLQLQNSPNYSANRELVVRTGSKYIYELVRKEFAHNSLKQAQQRGKAITNITKRILNYYALVEYHAVK